MNEAVEMATVDYIPDLEMHEVLSKVSVFVIHVEPLSFRAFVLTSKIV